MERKIDYLLPNSGSTPGEKVGTFESRAIAVLEDNRLSILLEEGSIELRSFRTGDRDRLQSIANSKEIAENFIGFPHPYSIDDAKAWVESNTQLTHGGIALAIICGGVFVGSIHLEIRKDDTKFKGIISFWLSVDSTGKGIMQRSLRVFCEYILAHTQIEEISAHVFCTNVASRNLIKKVGFACSEEAIPVEKGEETIYEDIYTLDRVGRDRLKYIEANRKKIQGTFLNFEDFINDYLGQKKGTYTLNLRNGGTIHLRARNEEVSDIDIVGEIYIDCDYDLTFLSQVENPVVVDIGAQIGLFSLYAAGELRNPRIYSYEPFPQSYALLSKNAQGSPITHFPIAVSGRTGSSKLFVSPSNVGGHSMVHGEDSNAIPVETVSLDELMTRNRIQKIDLLKIDCEGSEYEIFFHLSSNILERISRIYMEVHYNGNLAEKYGKYSMVDFLRKNGFEVKILKEFYYEGEGEFYVIFAHNCIGELLDNKDT